MTISNSFTDGEIDLLEFILQSLLKGTHPSMATRHKDFASICRKIMSMKQKLALRKLQKDPEQES